MLKNMKIGNKLIALVGVFVVGLLAFGGVAFYTLSRVQVNGPIYRELVEKKDIIADILPPPMYIIEPFFVVLDIQGELENGAPAAEIEPLIENFMALREAYYARLDYWKPILTPEDSFYQALMVDSVDSANRFFDVVETRYLPLVRARDAEAASLVIHGEIEDLYLEHRAHIDVAVQQTNTANAVLEAATAAEVQIETVIVIVIGLAAIVIGIAFGWWIGRGITNPVRAMSAAAAQIAMGDVNQSISLYSKDEMGQMADSFRSMITYLKEMVTAAQAIAQGDLTVTVNARAQQDALAHALNDMLTNLRELAGLLNANAEQVSAAASTLATAADMAGGATQQISVTMTQVAKGATQQADSITHTAASVEEMRRAIDSVAAGAQEQAVAVAQTADVMGKLSAAVADIRRAAQQQAQGMTRAAQMRANLADALHQVASATDEVSTEAERSARSASEGIRLAVQTIDGMQRVSDATEQLAHRVRDLGRRSGQVGSIVETIDDIASQTNLLALNAAIEAARAGEHGKGFAVVADEVRKLAERSAQATKEIGELIRAVQTGANEVGEAMHQTGADVASARQLTEQAGNAFEQLARGAEASAQRVKSVQVAVISMRDASTGLENAVAAAADQAERNGESAEHMALLSEQAVTSLDSVSSVVEQNTAATEQMAASATEVTGSIENIASVSEENSAAVEEVSASAEEMNAQVQEVTQNAQRLAEMAAELRRLVSRFKLSADEGLAPAPVKVHAVRPVAVHGPYA